MRQGLWSGPMTVPQPRSRRHGETYPAPTSSHPASPAALSTAPSPCTPSNPSRSRSLTELPEFGEFDSRNVDEVL